MLLVIAYSRAARGSLRNVHRAHEGSVVRRFGRVALFEATELGAFLALRLREKHPGEVQLSRVEPFNEFDAVPERVREAAHAYERRADPNVPYAKFAVGTDHPAPEELADREL
ncbi:hypothetical protein ACFQPA_10120 [Halomarina halobia]|uniref:Uncharacterized protein n=1 Tax=Halomarina halobia TaxID=3033386 RepID=A0ABD6AAX6_9EURY|nr:hypothetical protein [Halomarina sp. PSR21]